MYESCLLNIHCNYQYILFLNKQLVRIIKAIISRRFLSENLTLKLFRQVSRAMSCVVGLKLSRDDSHHFLHVQVQYVG